MLWVTPPVQALGRLAFAQTPSDSTGAVTTLVTRLMQGTTEIASWTHEHVAVEFTTIEQLLSDVQADLITDYGDLRLIFEATATAPPEDDGGGGPVEAGPVTARNLLAGGSSTDTTSFTTGSAAPGSDKALLLTVVSTRASAKRGGGGGGDIPAAVSGLGLDWTQLASATHESVSHPQRVTLYRAVSRAAQDGGTLTFAFANAQTFCGWTLTEFDSVDVASADEGLVQTVAAAGSGSDRGLTVALAPFESADNATFGFFHINSSSQVMTPGDGFAAIDGGAYRVGGQPSAQGLSQFRQDDDTSVDASGSGKAGWVGVAVELRRARG